MSAAVPVGLTPDPLGRTLAQIAATLSCVSRGTVARIVAVAPVARTEEDVVRALGGLGVRVADLPALPSRAPDGVPESLLGHVERLRLRLSVQLPFGRAVKTGFRVLDGFALEDGRALDVAALTAGRGAVAASADPAAAATLFDQLATVVADGRADELVLWELASWLRGLHTAGLGHRELTTQAGLLGLVRSEAEDLAAALVEEDGFDLLEPARRDVAAPAVEVLPPADLSSDLSFDLPVDLDPEPSGGDVTEVFDPVPTTDVVELGLEVRPGRPGMLAIRWAFPGGSDVALRRAAHPPAEHVGAVVADFKVWQHGDAEPTNGAIRGPDGHWTRQIAVPAEVAHLTIYAIRNKSATVGPTVALSEAQPVRGLQVDRFGREARLGWGWPEYAVSAEVTLIPAGSAVPARTLTCNHRSLQRGLHVDIGHRGWTFSVRAVYGFESNRVLAPPVTFDLPPMGVPIRYTIERRRWRGRASRNAAGVGKRWHYDVRVTVEDDCRLPGLRVVESRAERRPATPSAGATVASSPPRDVTAGEVVVIPVDLSRPGPSWLALVVDPTATTGCDAVAIEHPPESESRRK